MRVMRQGTEGKLGLTYLEHNWIGLGWGPKVSSSTPMDTFITH